MEVPLNAVCRSCNYQILEFRQIRPDHPADPANTVKCWISAGLLQLSAIWNLCKKRAEITHKPEQSSSDHTYGA